MQATAAQSVEDRKRPLSDSQLVKACLRGDEEAWSALINKYKNLIFSIPIKYHFSQEDAADIFQAVCADLISELPNLRKPKALAGWLLPVTPHKWIPRKRQAQRYPSHAPAPSEPPASPPEIPANVLRPGHNEQTLLAA